ncbi:hypothetical protein C2E23DRAFT_817948 [Lenzites betulinus]|nr:hypothetical protein C2E23DRAFT_817948 [Lenzites betulinus]
MYRYPCPCPKGLARSVPLRTEPMGPPTYTVPNTARTTSVPRCGPIVRLCGPSGAQLYIVGFPPTNGHAKCNQ